MTVKLNITESSTTLNKGMCQAFGLPPASGAPAGTSVGQKEECKRFLFTIGSAGKDVWVSGFIQD